MLLLEIASTLLSITAESLIFSDGEYEGIQGSEIHSDGAIPPQVTTPHQSVRLPATYGAPLRRRTKKGRL